MIGESMWWDLKIFKYLLLLLLFSLRRIDWNFASFIILASLPNTAAPAKKNTAYLILIFSGGVPTGHGLPVWSFLRVCYIYQIIMIEYIRMVIIIYTSK